MTDTRQTDRRHWTVFLIFLRLGLTSFGGPIAHLGYFRDEFVVRRQWLSERSYADLVALCQFLPGPASSQVGIALGLSRSGYGGALAAWMGFTLPSAIALILFALGIARYGDVIPVGVLHGLKVVAVAVVAQAVWGMARNLCPDTPRRSIMTAATCFVLLVPSALGQVGVIAMGAIIGLCLFKPEPSEARDPLPIRIRRRAGMFWLVLFCALLLGLPLLATWFPSQMLSRVDAFYRAGSLVFGGGHVVLPLLQAEVVPTGWVGNDAFLAGYGAAQAIPGPLFTFAAFLGASMNQAPNGWLGGLAVLGASAAQHPHASGADGHQCGGGRCVARRPLSAGMDECDSRPAGLCPGPCGAGCVDVLESCAVAGGTRQRRHGWAVEYRFISKNSC